MYQNEANANARKIRIVILDNLGSPAIGVAGCTILIAKSSQVDMVVAAAGDVTPITGSVTGGLYEFALSQAETDTLGDLAYEITKADQSIQPVRGLVTIEAVPQVASVGFFDTIIEGPNQYDGQGEVNALNRPNMDVSLAAALREILAYCAHAAQGLSSNAGQIKSRIGGRNRMVFQVNDGNRVITSYDDR